jgi:hypothetical protein
MHPLVWKLWTSPPAPSPADGATTWAILGEQQRLHITEVDTLEVCFLLSPGVLTHQLAAQDAVEQYNHGTTGN